MLIKNTAQSSLKESQLTDEKYHSDRRSLLKKLGIGLASLPFVPSAQAGLFDVFSDDAEASDNSGLIFQRDKLNFTSAPNYQVLKPLTPEKKILQYNNFPD